MRLKVIVPELRYGGKELREGDEFEASEKDGKLLVAIKKATASLAPRRGESRPPKTDELALQASAEGEQAPRRRRRFQRRDMRAED
jgi:hypothetical protein